VRLILTRDAAEQWAGVGEQAKSARACTKFLVEDRHIQEIAMDIDGLRMVFVASLLENERHKS
jgi:hypothetical protein